MSIVMEAPVRAQVAGPVGTDSAAGAGRSGGEEAVAVVQRAAGAGRSGRGLTSSYITESRVDRRFREDVPLTAAQAEQLGRLFRLHNDHLVRYLAARLGWTRWALAEDLAQEVWRELACRPQDVAGWQTSDGDSFGLLAVRGRHQISQYLRLGMNKREQLLASGPDDNSWSLEEGLDVLAGPGPDTTVCAVAGLMDDQDADWRGCYAQAIELLPARQREVLELSCQEGMTIQAIAARLDLTHQTVSTTLARAVATLRDPQAVAALRERQDRDRLPDHWERILDRLPAAQVKVVRLRARGLNNAEVARRLGRDQVTTRRAYARAVRNLWEMVADHRMDPVQAAPQKTAGTCARRCASGCYLRAGVAA